MHPKKRQLGLTLIEILVAFVMMAISVALILQIIGKSNRSISISDEYNHASIIAESLLSSTLYPNSLEETSGAVADKFFWQYSISPYESSDYSAKNNFQLYEINISVEWNSNHDKRNVKLSTLRLIDHESSF